MYLGSQVMLDYTSTNPKCFTGNRKKNLMTEAKSNQDYIAREKRLTSLKIIFVCFPIWGIFAYLAILGLANLISLQFGQRLGSLLSKDQLLSGWFLLHFIVWLLLMFVFDRRKFVFMPLWWVTVLFFISNFGGITTGGLEASFLAAASGGVSHMPRH